MRTKRFQQAIDADDMTSQHLRRHRFALEDTTKVFRIDDLTVDRQSRAVRWKAAAHNPPPSGMECRCALMNRADTGLTL
jgi:hypothetical protein